MSARFVEGLYHENIDYGRTCEVQSEETLPQDPSRQISNDRSSAVVLPLQKSLTSSKVSDTLPGHVEPACERRMNRRI